MRSKSSLAFTLIELLVVIAIISILAAILFPVFAKAREKARQVACLSNLRQLGLAFQQYVDDNDQFLPGSGAPSLCANQPCYNGWVPPMVVSPSPGNTSVLPAKIELGQVYSYTKSTGIYVCPSDPNGNTKRLSYSMNYLLTLFNVSQVDAPTTTVLLIDEQNTLNDPSFSPCIDMPTRQHTGGADFLFLDGHCKWQRPENQVASNYYPNAGFNAALLGYSSPCTTLAIPPNQ